MYSRKLFTRRYLAALTLIGVVLAGSFTGVMHRLKENHNDGYIINTAGQQRMLSQRIALLALKVVSAPSNAKQAEFVAKLKSAAGQMAKNHAALVNGHRKTRTASAILKVYQKPQGISSRTADFLDLTEQFLLSHGIGETPSAVTISRFIAAIASNGFLDELDGAVQAYQRQFEADIETFKSLESTILGIGLLVLVLEALFIFRPMAKEMHRARSSLVSANDELRQFSHRLSHDLRAPVATALGLVSLAQESNTAGQPADTRFALSRINHSLKKMDLLMQAVMDVTRSQGKPEKPALISFDEVIGETLKSLSNRENFDDIAVDLSIANTQPVEVRKTLLRQCLDNLLANAIVHRDPDRAHPRIDISASTTEGLHTIAVSDNGSGIDPRFHNQLFDMFTRFDPERADGSGLGLYIARNSAAALGGTLTYQPLKDGSRFTLTWPVQEPQGSG